MSSFLALDPIACAIDWIIASLRGNVELTGLLGTGIRVSTLPHSIDQQYPAIGISLNNPKDQGVVGGVIVNSELLFAITAIDIRDDIASVQPISHVMHILLHDMFGTVNPVRSGLGTVLSCERMEPIYYTDRDKEERVWQYLGGLYKIRVQ